MGNAYTQTPHIMNTNGITAGPILRFTEKQTKVKDIGLKKRKKIVSNFVMGK